jgi:phage terminase small subunit
MTTKNTNNNKKKLTLKQEKFCQEYIANGGNGTGAYRVAYDCRKMKEETVNNNAYKLLKNNEITTRLQELQKPLIEKFNYTIEDSFRKLIEIQNIALNSERPDLTNAIKSEELKGKLLGLYTDKVENINPTTVINNTSISLDKLKEFKDKLENN